jgi:hypothetical protein
MPARDTTPDAAAVQEAAYRHMGGAGRLKIALDLSNFVHALAVTGIRKRHPEYTAEQATAALARQLYPVPADHLED